LARKPFCFLPSLMTLGLGTHLFVKVPRPGNSEVTELTLSHALDFSGK